MLRLSKKMEYALIAMQYVALNSGRVVSAKEIAEHYGISFEFLAKALQTLMRAKFIVSQQGVSGGYVLAGDPQRLTVGAIIEAVEGKPAIVECCGAGGGTCTMHPRCPIKNPMAIIQQRIDAALHSMTLAQLASGSGASGSEANRPEASSSEASGIYQILPVATKASIGKARTAKAL
jgi:Rrf2 family protein